MKDACRPSNPPGVGRRQGYFFLNLCTPDLAQVFKEAFSWHNFSRWPTGSWKKKNLVKQEDCKKFLDMKRIIYIHSNFVYVSKQSFNPWNNLSRHFLGVLMIHWLNAFFWLSTGIQRLYINFFFWRFRESNSKEFCPLGLSDDGGHKPCFVDASEIPNNHLLDV